jgi:hypothetical protein
MKRTIQGGKVFMGNYNQKYFICNEQVGTSFQITREPWGFRVIYSVKANACMQQDQSIHCRLL